jgi:hypothetical protein
MQPLVDFWIARTVVTKYMPQPKLHLMSSDRQIIRRYR